MLHRQLEAPLMYCVDELGKVSTVSYHYLLARLAVLWRLLLPTGVSWIKWLHNGIVISIVTPTNITDCWSSFSFRRIGFLSRSSECQDVLCFIAKFYPSRKPQNKHFLFDPGDDISHFQELSLEYLDHLAGAAPAQSDAAASVAIVMNNHLLLPTHVSDILDL